MIASIKLQLLVATLGVSQFSGVFGAQGDFKEKRELLRRNLRSGSATADVKRNMQCKFVSIRFETLQPTINIEQRNQYDSIQFTHFFSSSFWKNAIASTVAWEEVVKKESVVSAAEVQTVEDGEGYDDYFSPSPEIQGIGESTDDDYFSKSSA